MSATPINPLDKYGDDDFFNLILRYGLYFGAFFQLACISASILLPMAQNEEQATIHRSATDSKNLVNDTQTNLRKSYKQRNKDKKKRR